MKKLHLNLKKKWFDMILSGEKKEEYREIKPYWFTRFLKPKNYCDWPEDIDEPVYDLSRSNFPDFRYDNFKDFLDYWNFEFRDYSSIIFSNGYQKNRPQFEIELKNITIDCGKEEWGAIGNNNYFVLELGEILWKN